MMSSTNFRSVFFSVCLVMMLFLAGCGSFQSAVDLRRPGLNQNNYEGGWQAGKASHNTLYTNHIDSKSGGAIYTHKDLFVGGDIFVDGRVYFDQTSTSYLTERGTITTCAPSSNQFDDYGLLVRCDVLVKLHTNVHSKTTSSYVVMSGEGGPLGFMAQCPDVWSGGTPNCADGNAHSIAVLDGTENLAYDTDYFDPDTSNPDFQPAFCDLQYNSGFFVFTQPSSGHCEMIVTKTFYRVTEPPSVFPNMNANINNNQMVAGP